MTVQTNTNVASFNGNGVTQIFPIAFKFNNRADLVVLLVDKSSGASSRLILNSSYTVSGEGDEEGGLINVLVPPTNDQQLIVTRLVDILQLTDLRNQGKFFAEVHEDALDLLTMIAQQQQSEVQRSLRVAESDPEPSRLPPASQRAGKLFAFDVHGNPTTAVPVSDSATELRLELAQGVTPVNGGNFSPATSLLAGFVTAQARSLDSLFADAVRIDVNMGLVPDDPWFDNGPVLNQILSVAAAGRVPLDGYGATFYVRTPVEPKSHQRLRRCRIVSMGSPDGASVAKSHLSVMHLNGMSETLTDMHFEDVHVDGSRQLWPNIALISVGPEGGGGEDGGMHAWRLAGRITNSTWVRCSGNNAGTAGWAIHNPLPSSSVVEYQKSNLRFYDCDAVGNREHGMFADSFKGIKWIGGRLTGNGLDLNTTDPLVHGNRGARDTNGKLFGGPFDLEAYGPNYLASMFSDFLLQSVDCRGNALMPLVYNPIASNVAGFVPARNLRFIDCDFDFGLATGSDRPTGVDGVALNIKGVKDGDVSPYSAVTVASRLSGRPQFDGVSKLDCSQGFIEALSPKAILNNCEFYNVSCPSLAAGVQVSPQPSVTITRTGGSATAAFGLTLLSTRPADGCGVSLAYSVSITGALSGGGPLRAVLNIPVGYIIDGVSFDVFQPTGENSVRSSILVQGLGASANIYVDTVPNDNFTAFLRVKLLQSI